MTAPCGLGQDGDADAATAWERVAGFLVAIVAVAIALLPPDVSLVFDSAGSAGGDADWFGRRYSSVSVTHEGHDWVLVAGTRIALVFEERDGGRMVRWNAGCNTWGAPVTVGPQRLQVGQSSSSASGCPDELDRQDAWLRRFFGADPGWTRSGGRLTLTAGDTVIAFAETTEEGVAAASAFTGVWSGPDGTPAERGEGPDRTFEVAAHLGPRHCDWESVVFLSVVQPAGTTYVIGPDAPTVWRYVRDPDSTLHRSNQLLGSLGLDTELPDDAQFSGYATGQARLWFGADGGERYAYLTTEQGVERWPRAREQIACG